eukprot:1195765-Prorocentrum_minimum.AAC.6
MEALSTPAPPAKVVHQKVCVEVDVQRRRLSGYTDVTILVPKQQSINVGLHTCGLLIKSVSVNGEPTKYVVRDAIVTGQNGDVQMEENSGCMDEPASTRGMSQWLLCLSRMSPVTKEV